MPYNPDIHHRRSIRLRDYDYTQEGAYFITICTKEKQCIFGDVKNGKMHLNHLGAIAYNCWQEIPQHFPHIILDVFVIMPNHLHGILWISQANIIDNNQRTFSNIVPGSISSIIRAYKAAVTKRINQLCHQKNISSVWQRNFYEHINQNEQSLDEIRHYTLQNPLKWENDPENHGKQSLILLDLPF